VITRKSLTPDDTDYLTDSLGYATAGADEPPPVFLINPLRQRRALRPLGAVVLVVMMFALRGLRAAMFTEPAITQIEEVGRLVHRAAFYMRSAP
jgi:hypothetical protein